MLAAETDYSIDATVFACYNVCKDCTDYNIDAMLYAKWHAPGETLWQS